MPTTTLHQYYQLGRNLALSHRAALVPVETKVTHSGRRLVYVRIPKAVTLTNADKNLIWWALRRHLRQSPIPPRAVQTPRCLIYEQAR